MHHSPLVEKKKTRSRVLYRGRKKDPSKEATSLRSANGKPIGLLPSPKKEVDVATCKLEVH